MMQGVRLEGRLTAESGLYIFLTAIIELLKEGCRKNSEF